MNKFIISVILICHAVLTIHAQQVVTGFEAPETVIKVNDKLFVSNIGGQQPNPFAVDGNGFISTLSLDGKFLERKFSKANLNAPKGLTVAGTTLYTADINRVVGLNINSGEQVFELVIPGAALLNGLCTIGDNSIIVSETLSGKIYMINIVDKSYKSIGHIPGANGVTYLAQSKTLYACGIGQSATVIGKLFVQDMSRRDTVFTELANSPAGVFDGLAFMDNNHLLATDWINFAQNRGRVILYSLKDHDSKEYAQKNGGSADIYFDETTQQAYWLQGNNLLIGKLSDIK